ncbi:TlyA family RNA methyltransferase [Kyrpidia spormannii]|uniref:2'-O-ribose RNA methyltransferase n=1 Tax=Kyrpidia spormannii TaxID=2055160 RepID=A0ACA8Z7S8_9BACL|nr:TlyA family RNA methyltransferase [Kyrpidia spormannii]CAB3391148.1 putative 2'-O-ribose RNA methyltransferase [Kyrpidia spormannii]
MSDRERADVLLVQRGLFPSREKARAAIMAGRVFSRGRRIDKAGTPVGRDEPLEVRGEDHPFVSRGGLKLEKAFQEFPVSVEGRVVLDIGASTGGFTDCLLRHGARMVYAVDVGYGQLDWRLRNDDRVIPVERTNARYLKRADLPGPDPDQAVMDVSFISVRLVFPVLWRLLPDGADVITLVKPQFEAGRESVGRGGIVRDPAVHRRVLREVMEAAGNDGFEVKGLTFSPITGGDGNMEFLLYLRRKAEDGLPDGRWQEEIPVVVEEAHRVLGQIRRKEGDRC